jgi:DNA replication and repair protein RecF
VSPDSTLRTISIQGLRSYASLEAAFGSGPQLIVGPNAAGKTTLLEAIVLLAWGRSHRTSTDGELVRWGSELARIEGQVGAETVEVALVRPPGAPGAPVGSGARKRIRVNGVARRAAGLVGLLRTVVFAPEEMLLVVGSPGLRRASLDQLATQRSAAYGRDLATYGRTLQQRNSLLRAIREEQAGRDELRFWDASFLDAGGAIVAERLRLLEDLAGPLARAHAEIAPDEAAATRLAVTYATNAPALPGESPRDALARRLAETADKEIWNGSTLVGPHRDDLVFGLDGRDMSGFASRGQQRTAILAFKLAELDLLTAQDGRPPLLLLDDVFSELDPDRRSHLVRRIAALPQAFVTTTTLDDLDPALVSAATAWEVVPDGGGGAGLRSIEAPGNGSGRRPADRAGAGASPLPGTP